MSAPLRLGVLRLVDSLPAVVAEARGLFRAAGLDVTLHVEPSWANVADKLAWDALDAAILLAPLAIAAPLGLRGRATPLRIPMATSCGGNSVVVGGAVPSLGANAMRGFIDWLRGQAAPVRFGVVHVFSMHNLLLRHWLAASGMSPDQALDVVVVPPERMVGELAAGRIVGFCAGAPWGEHARATGEGRIVCSTSAIRPSHVEKCLVIAQPWADANRAGALALVGAMRQAQAACEPPSAAIAALASDRLGLPHLATVASLVGVGPATRAHFVEPAALADEFAWIAREMRRWGWLSGTSSETATLASMQVSL